MESDTSLADLVIQQPAVIPVLDHHRLDYFTNGHLPLTDACARRGVNLDEVLVAISRLPVTPAPSWTSLGVVQLVDHILDEHHSYLHRELGPLCELAERVRDAYGDRWPELTPVADAMLAVAADLEPHLLKEEQVLFPRIRALATDGRVDDGDCGGLRTPIRTVLGDHDHASDLLNRLWGVTDGFRAPGDATDEHRELYARLARLDADNRLHTHKENNLLFPAVLELERALNPDGA